MIPSFNDFVARKQRRHMHEKRFCLNCNSVSEMNVHGRCPLCDSDAVVLAESIGPFERMRSDSLAELEQLFALKGER